MREVAAWPGSGRAVTGVTVSIQLAFGFRSAEVMPASVAG